MPAKKFPPQLKDMQERVEEIARSCGLDFFRIIYELLDWREMSEVASYAGFPNRYPHWSFGMEYEHLRKGYTYGLQRIYEMVVNNDPCYAYLLDSNNPIDQKLVMAHVCGHCDFFKNNSWFARTNRKMIDEIANHASRVRVYAERWGSEKVESFLDACLSIEDLIDWHGPFIKRAEDLPPDDGEEEEDDFDPRLPVNRGYMEEYINPPEEVRAVREARKKELDEERKRKLLGPVPADQQKDVLLFLLEHAPLEKWQRNILAMVREEAYYFAPQGQTKIMNEGWATYWHAKMMTEHGLAGDKGIVDFADHHSGTVHASPGRLNPYKIGYEMFLDIEERWNKGRHGKEYEECEDQSQREHWNTGEMAGSQEIFAARRYHNDVTFLDAYLTPEFCRKQNLFSWKYDPNTGVYVVDSTDFQVIKNKLLFSLTNFGRPFVYVQSGNHRNQGELLLRHRHEGIDLDTVKTGHALLQIHKIWQRPVRLRTVIEGNPYVIFTEDGRQALVKKENAAA